MATLPNPYQDSSADRPILGYNKKNSGFVEKPKRTSFFQWVPSDAEQLKTAEARMLKPIEGTYTQTMVKTPLCEINTLMCESPLHDKNIVLLHGFGFGLAQWVPNISTFAQHGNVYAIDMPGFARSGRAPSVGGGQEALLFFIQTLEEWIKAMWGDEGGQKAIKKITLVGHSFGGFISGKFALNYPHRIEKLVLVDPFGVNEGVPDEVVAERAKQRTTMEKLRNSVANTLFYKVNPLCPLRGLGPLAPSIVGPKMAKKRDQWQGHTEEGAVVDYLYHANAQSPSGESAFSKCVTGLGAGFGDGFVAKFPLLHELPKLDPTIPLFFIYGSHTWIPQNAGYQVLRLREEYFTNEWLPAEVARRSELPEDHPDLKTPIQRVLATTKCHVVNRAGHHVYVDNAKRFNGVIAEVLCPYSERRRVISQPGSATNRSSTNSEKKKSAAAGGGTTEEGSDQKPQDKEQQRQDTESMNPSSHVDPFLGVVVPTTTNSISTSAAIGASTVSSSSITVKEDNSSPSSSSTSGNSMRVTLRGPASSPPPSAATEIEKKETACCDKNDGPVPADAAGPSPTADEGSSSPTNPVLASSSSFDVVSSVSPSAIKEEGHSRHREDIDQAQLPRENGLETAECADVATPPEAAGVSVEHSLNAWDEQPPTSTN